MRSDLQTSLLKRHYGPEALRASLSASQENSSASSTSGTLPRPSCGSLTSAALQSSLANRLRQQLENTGSMIYSLSWKDKVTPAGRPYCQRQASAPRTNAIDFSLVRTNWQTPTVTCIHERSEEATQRRKEFRASIGRESLAPGNLAEQASLYLTGWPTPTTRDHKDGAECLNVPINSLLGRQVWMANWPTPCANNSTGAGHQGRDGGHNLQTAVSLLQPTRITASGELLTGSDAAMENSGQLSPAHSRWLMGFPPEWDACAVMAMPSCRKSPQNSSKPLQEQSMTTVIKKKKVLPPPAPVKKKKPVAVTVSPEKASELSDRFKKEFEGSNAPLKKKKLAPATEEIPAVNVAPGHALLSPSYSKTWLSCAAALAAGLDEPNVSGAAALEGTMCHQVLENVINRLIDPQYPLECEMPAWATINGKGNRNQGQAAVDYIGVAPLSSHPRMTFTADHAELITPFIDYVKGLMDAGYTVFPEMRVDLSLVLGAPNTFGTADLIAFKGDHLIVGDLKMGRHSVSPGTLDDLNPQMGLYGVGVLERYRKTKNFQQVTLLIAQPRAGGLKFLDDIPAATMYAFGQFARDRAAAALECVTRGRKGLKKEDFTPTPGGCQWCRFRDKCSAKLQVVTGQAPKGNEISDEELFAAWQKIPLLESQIQSTKSEVLKRLMDGRKIGDLKVVTGSQGQRKWADEDVAEKYLLGKLYAKAYEKKLITPTAAVKLLKGDPELEQLITRAAGKPSISTTDDKRKGYESVTDDDLSD